MKLFYFCSIELELIKMFKYNLYNDVCKMIVYIQQTKTYIDS